MPAILRRKLGRVKGNGKRFWLQIATEFTEKSFSDNKLCQKPAWNSGLSQRYGNLETPGHLTNRHVVPPAQPAISWTTNRSWKRTAAAAPPSHPRDVLQPATLPDPACRSAQVPFLLCSASV